MCIAQGFIAAKRPFTASAIRLFAALTDGPATLDKIAAKCHIPRRTLRRWLICQTAAAAAMALITATNTAHAEVVVFDFAGAVAGVTATPFSQTADALTANFASDQDPGAFQVDASPFATFTVLMVDSPGPAFMPGASLTITFSQPVDDVSLPFATDGAGPLMLSSTAPGGASLGATSATGVVPPGGYVFPEGVITFAAPDISSVTLSDANDPFFAIGSVMVAVATPEPIGIALLGVALTGLAIARRRSAARA
jgi:hypothetical protein